MYYSNTYKLMDTKNPYIKPDTNVNDAKAINILWLINVKLSTREPEIIAVLRSLKDLQSYSGEEIEAICRTVEGLM